MKKQFWSIMLAAAVLAGVKLSKQELADGRIVDVKDDGSVVLVAGDDESAEESPLADGEYELKAGGKLTVKDGKKVEAAAPAKTDEKPAVEAAATAPVTSTPAAGAAGAAAPAAEKTDEKAEGDVTKAQAALAGVLEETDAVKLTAQLKKALGLLGVTELSALKLEAVAMADGSEFQYNPITRRLIDASGQIVQTGVYACADGSYFKVNTEQWTNQIDAETYANATTKLAAVELKLKDAEDQLATVPSTTKLSLSADTLELSAQDKPVAPHLQFLAAHRADRPR